MTLILNSKNTRQALKNTFSTPGTWIVLFLGLVLFLESLWVIYQKTQARSLNIEYYQVIAAQDSLNNQWTQLLIEEGTWGSSAYIEQAAQNYLDMQFPKPQDTRIIN